MIRTLFLLFLVVSISAAIRQVAVAQDLEKAAILRCDKNSDSFVVRFGLYSTDRGFREDDVIVARPEVEKMWSAIGPELVTACVLPNGRKVVVSASEGQAFAYGAGGADPDAFFSLKIDDSTIYYKKLFYSGYGASQYLFSAVSYQGDVLRECPGPKDEAQQADTLPECADVSDRLKGNALSEAEKGELDKDQVRQSLQDGLSPLCRKLRDDEDAALTNNQEQSAAYKDLGETPSGYLSEMSVDINNDGMADRIFRIGGRAEDCQSCGTHYFDGSYLYIFTGAKEHVNEFLEFIRHNDDKKNSNEPKMAKLSDWHGILISAGLAGSSLRYVYNVPFVSDGTTYIYSFETNADKIPSAVISKMHPDNTIEAVCKFP